MARGPGACLTAPKTARSSSPPVTLRRTVSCCASPRRCGSSQVRGEQQWCLLRDSSISHNSCHIWRLPLASQALSASCVSDDGCPGQVLFLGDHLAADSVAEWNTRFEPNDDGFLGISRNFNCELLLHTGTNACWWLHSLS